jgi:hypothetical protein
MKITDKKHFWFFQGRKKFVVLPLLLKASTKPQFCINVVGLLLAVVH